MTAVLEVRDLAVDIPVEAGVLHAVRGISFSIEKGRSAASCRNLRLCQSA